MQQSLQSFILQIYLQLIQVIVQILQSDRGKQSQMKNGLNRQTRFHFVQNQIDSESDFCALINVYTASQKHQLSSTQSQLTLIQICKLVISPIDIAIYKIKCIDQPVEQIELILGCLNLSDISSLICVNTIFYSYISKLQILQTIHPNAINVQSNIIRQINYINIIPLFAQN